MCSALATASDTKCGIESERGSLMRSTTHAVQSSGNSLHTMAQSRQIDDDDDDDDDFDFDDDEDRRGGGGGFDALFRDS